MPGSATKRTTGRRLQQWRHSAWVSAGGRCAACGRLVENNAVEWEGFELDHIVPLDKGGADDLTNCQILCIPECHDRKTAEDEGRPYRPAMRAGPDGWPVPVSHRPARQRR